MTHKLHSSDKNDKTNKSFANVSRRKASAPFRGRHSSMSSSTIHHQVLRPRSRLSIFIIPPLPPLNKPSEPLWRCLWNKDDILVFYHLIEFPVQRLPFINQKHWTKLREMKSNHMAVLEIVTTSNLLLRVCSSFMFSCFWTQLFIVYFCWVCFCFLQFQCVWPLWATVVRLVWEKCHFSWGFPCLIAVLRPARSLCTE